MGLYTVYKRCPALDRGGHMHRFSDVFHTHALFQATLGISVNAVRTLHGMGHRQAYKDLLPLCQHARLQGGVVPHHELLEQLRAVLAYFPETIEIVGLVIITHKNLLLNEAIDKYNKYIRLGSKCYTVAAMDNPPTAKSTSALGIFFRIPEYGRVKKRLAAYIGDETALEVYTAMLRATIEKAHQMEGVDLYGFYEGEASILMGLGINFETEKQAGEDLGEKMLNAFSFLFHKGYEKAVLIGTDVPDLPVSHLTTAFSKLDTCGAVLGPSEDGGYYLIGLRHRAPALFSGLQWGGPTVFRDTVSVLEHEKVPYALLPQWYDIDDIDGLKRWDKKRSP